MAGMTLAIRRAALLLGLFLALPAPCVASDALNARERAADFDALWRAVDERYAYFGRQRASWRRVRDAWRPRAVRAQTRGELVSALEGALDQLRDDHVSLSERTPRSPRRVPAEIDVWAAWSGKQAVVEAVRTFGDADVAGLRPGHVIARVDGLPVERVVRDIAPRAGVADAAEERAWALRRALAGPRSGTLQVEVREATGAKTLTVEHRGTAAANGQLVGRRIGEGRDLGYIRVKSALSDPRLPGQFQQALDYLKDTRALILDLREAWGDGGTAAVESILARFATGTVAWRQREPRGGERVIDTVEPRGTPYRAPVVVLVDRWTAGDGEALAAGLQAVAKARLIGTPMAGLRGEIGEARLPHSGIVVRFPTQKSFDANGQPRESLAPALTVYLAAPQGGPGDPILYQALKLLERK